MSDHFQTQILALQKLSLRPATNTDRNAIKDLVFKSLREFNLTIDPSSEDRDLEDVETFYFKDGGTFSVLETQEGHIIGSVGLMPLGQGRCELRKMYVEVYYRGRGLGKLLLDHALTEARRLSFSKVELKTASVLQRAIDLYVSTGFQPRPLEESCCRCDQAYELVL